MNKWLNRAANLFLLLLCSESLLKLIADSFQLTAAPKTYGWLALLCVLLWAAFFIRRCFLPGIAGAMGLLWLLIRYGKEDLRPELLDIIRAIQSFRFNGFPNESVEAAFHASAKTHALVLLLLLFLVALLLAIVLSSEGFRVHLGLLLTVPLVGLCLAVSKAPPALPLLGMALFWVGLMISGDSYRPYDAAGQAVLLTLLPCLAVLGIALFFNRPADYVPEDRAAALTERFEQLSGALSSFWDSARSIPQRLGGIGGQRDVLSGWDQKQDGLDLTRPYDFSARASEIFTFRSSLGGSLYLRGRSLGSYTGTGWSETEEQTGFQTLNYAAYAVAMAGYTGSGTVQTGRFEIEADRAYDLLYLPYFTISESIGDSSIPAGGKTAYGGQYLLLTGGSFGPLPDGIWQEEQQYRAFAQEYYTRLPEKTREALLAYARLNGLSTTDSDILEKVVDTVCRGSTYDLGVGPYPDDDYAVYFLRSARRGYCIHYATAACCLYRALGFPARLCEGFLVTANPGGETIVRAADAHAWVEVWLDSVGWVPVEVTFGDSSPEDEPDSSPLFDTDTAPTEDRADRDSLSENRETGSGSDGTELPLDGGGDRRGPDEAYGTQNAGKPDEAQERAPGDDTKWPSNDEDHDDADDAPAEENATRKDRSLRWALAVLAAVLLAAAGRYALVRKRLRRRLTEPDGRLLAVFLYRQAQLVLRYGGEMPEAVLTAAEKASFSPHTVREEELRRSLEALNELTDQVQSKLRPLRRLLFRYHLGL